MSNDDSQGVYTPRMKQIIELAAQGLTDIAIASRLQISRHTVDTHWDRLRERIGGDSRTAIVAAYVKEKNERQNHEIRERNVVLESAHTLSWEEMAALLTKTQKQLTTLQARDSQLSRYQDYFERATHSVRVVIYELTSHSPVGHRYLSRSATTLGLDISALLEGRSTFYDIVPEEDLATIIEKSLGATYAPDERYIFLFRLKMPELRWIMDSHQAHYDENGALIGIIGVAIDVHDLVLAGVIQPAVMRIAVAAEPIQ